MVGSEAKVTKGDKVTVEAGKGLNHNMRVREEDETMIDGVIDL